MEIRAACIYQHLKMREEERGKAPRIARRAVPGVAPHTQPGTGASGVMGKDGERGGGFAAGERGEEQR